MSDGNLNGKVVRAGFWPACSNCAHCPQCQAGMPRHPAFPCQWWQWGHESVHFGDGTVLVLRPWMGTGVTDQPYMACPDYQVARSTLLEVQERHRRYLELERERAGVEARLEGYEQRGTYNGHVVGLYDRLEEIEKEQIALTMTEV